MKINRFKAWRPLNDLVEEVASVPYDVVDRQQAEKLAEGNPNSFLHVVRAEIDLPEIDNISVSYTHLTLPTKRIV